MDDDVLSAAIHSNAFSPDYVFRQYSARRTGIVRALTEDVDEFYEQCDPDKEKLGLHGLPDGTWEMRLPAEVPSEIPEPISGINFTRDELYNKDWLELVAVQSDAWLMSLAFYFAGRLAFDRAARRQLFTKINGISTVLEAVTAYKNKVAVIPNSCSKNKRVISKPPRPPNPNTNPVMKPTSPPTPVEENGTGDDGDNEDQDLTICGACMETYASDELWVCCDLCVKWFHGKCVQVTAHWKQYMCPGCRYRCKRSRGSAFDGSD